MTIFFYFIGCFIGWVIVISGASWVVAVLAPWCIRHWGKALSFLVIMLWLGSMTMAGLKTHYDPAVHDYVTSNFWGYAVILGTIPVCVLPLFLWDKPTQPKKPKKPKPQPLPPGRLTLPSTYFMPYCVCPRCDAEALHWLDTPSQHTQRVLRDSGADVRRVCRTCGSRWTQRVGLLANEVP